MRTKRRNRRVGIAIITLLITSIALAGVYGVATSGNTPFTEHVGPSARSTGAQSSLQSPGKSRGKAWTTVASYGAEEDDNFVIEAPFDVSPSQELHANLDDKAGAWQLDWLSAVHSSSFAGLGQNASHAGDGATPSSRMVQMFGGGFSNTGATGRGGSNTPGASSEQDSNDAPGDGNTADNGSDLNGHTPEHGGTPGNGNPANGDAGGKPGIGNNPGQGGTPGNGGNPGPAGKPGASDKPPGGNGGNTGPGGNTNSNDAPARGDDGPGDNQLVTGPEWPIPEQTAEVPEPASLGIMLTGLGLLGWSLRRRKPVKG
jgi:hypothetical protein